MYTYTDSHILITKLAETLNVCKLILNLSHNLNYGLSIIWSLTPSAANFFLWFSSWSQYKRLMKVWSCLIKMVYVKLELCQTYARHRSDKCFCPESYIGPLRQLKWYSYIQWNRRSSKLAHAVQIKEMLTCTSPDLLTKWLHSISLCCLMTASQSDFMKVKEFPHSSPKISVLRFRHFNTVNMSKAIMTVKCTDTDCSS